MPTFYEIAELDADWGDYGRFLFSGMNKREPNEPRFPIKVMRTGPYVPKFTFTSGYFVVHADIGAELEKQQFKGVSLAEVELSKRQLDGTQAARWKETNMARMADS